MFLVLLAIGTPGISMADVVTPNEIHLPGVELSENFHLELDDLSVEDAYKLRYVERSEVQFNGLTLKTNVTNFSLKFYKDQTEQAVKFLEEDPSKLEGFKCVMHLDLGSLYSQKEMSKDWEGLEQNNFVSSTVQSDLEQLIKYFSRTQNEGVTEYIISDFQENKRSDIFFPITEVKFINEDIALVISRVAGRETSYMLFMKEGVHE